MTDGRRANSRLPANSPFPANHPLLTNRSLPAKGPRHMRTTAAAVAIALATFTAPASRAGPAGPGDRQAPVDASSPIRVRGESPVDLGLPGVPLVEPFLVAHPEDPDRLAGAAMRVDTGAWKVVVFTSDDGGRSWALRSLPGTPDDRIAGDPWLVWADDGSLLLSTVKFVPVDDDQRVAVRVYRSADGGRTWTGPEQVPWTERGSFDHPVLTPAPGSERLFLTATYGLSGFMTLRAETASDDFEIVGRFVPDDLNNNLGSAVALDGSRLVFTHFDMSTPGDDRPLWAVRSADGGASFERALIRRGVTPWGFPMLAADHGDGPLSGRLYSTWVEPDAGGGLDVMLARSDDDGAGWSSPVRVNGGGEPTFRGRPFAAVNAAGIVGVTWNDRRHGREGEPCSDVYFAASTDGGETFLPERRLSTRTGCAGTEANARAARRWPMGGDYSGMAVDAAGRFRPVWADARTGVFQLYTATVELVGLPR